MLRNFITYVYNMRKGWQMLKKEITWKTKMQMAVQANIKMHLRHKM
jgi:hypothetical protein